MASKAPGGAATSTRGPEPGDPGGTCPDAGIQPGEPEPAAGGSVALTYQGRHRRRGARPLQLKLTASPRSPIALGQAGCAR